jgi:isopentenyl diphosphate isomerase/L-lactate dehydrogenase-like FMN-dependent dehydrogenase
VTGTAKAGRIPRGGRFGSYEELEALTRRRLPKALFHDMMHGAGRGVTARRNCIAFDEVEFVPRAAVGWPSRDLTTTVLGTKVSMPVLLSPVGALRLVHPHGAVGAARAARDAGVICAVSMYAGHTPEDVGQAVPDGLRWQQLYLSRGRPRAEQVIAQAAAHGFRALVVTVDTPVSPKRSASISISLRSALEYGPDLVRRPRWLARFLRDGMRLAAANEALGPRVNETALWSDMAWIKERWDGPLVVKGVVTAEDARRAVGAGADAIVVSNHGGMSVDGAPATLTCLQDVIVGADGQAEILLDGGIRQGADVVKAVAMGARAVMIGRPGLAGLGVAGQAGVAAVLEMFRDQVDIVLAMIGCPSVTALDTSFVRIPAAWFTGRVHDQQPVASH